MKPLTQLRSLYQSRRGRPVSRSATRGRRRLGRDSRGASEVVGAILIFGLILSVLVLIQANAVPAENERVEFEHNQRVQQDLLALDAAILEAATDGTPASSEVELAARYPSRFFLINPAIGAGTIETFEQGTLTIDNAVADDSNGYWDGSAKSFETRTLRYRPSYNEYRSAPVSVYEHGSLINEFDGAAALPVDEGRFIDDGQLQVLLIDGSLSRASTTGTGIETVPLSVSTETLRIESADASGIQLTLPTTLTRAQWESVLAEQIDDGTVSVTGWTAGDPYNTLSLTLAAGEYDLRIASVGVSGGVDRTALGPRYITAAAGDTLDALPTSETRTLAVRVTDQYGNPVAGEVDFSTTAGSFQTESGTQASVTATAGADGIAEAVFVPLATGGSATVTAERDFNGDSVVQDFEGVSFTVNAVTDDFDFENDPNGVSNVNPWATGSVRVTDADISGTDVTVYFQNTGTVDQDIDTVRLMFYVSNNRKVVDEMKFGARGNNRVEVSGDWVTITPTITIPADGNEHPVEMRFGSGGSLNGAGQYDFFGLAIVYDSFAGNYYIQLTP